MKPGKIVCVVPSIRPEMMEKFRAKWWSQFEKYDVTLVVVWDGEFPMIEVFHPKTSIGTVRAPASAYTPDGCSDLFCRWTDACRNWGFVVAAHMGAEYVLTLDDDVYPLKPFEHGFGLDHSDPIGDHLKVLSKRVPLDWMNTAHMDSPYLRGVPYFVRDQAPVKLSHGVWVGTPDFDGETQARFESEPEGVPFVLPYYVGPVPREVSFPMCGMSVMVHRDALPYFYFAPMGPDSGFPDLHRFADIWCGLNLKSEFDIRGWACYTGGSTVFHSRASNSKKNMEQERLGRKWMEELGQDEWSPESSAYLVSWVAKRTRYAKMIKKLMGVSDGG